MEKYTFILSIFPIAIPLLYLLLTEKNVSLIKYLRKKKEKYIIETYKSFAFNKEKLVETNEAIEKIKSGIYKIKNNSS